MFCQGASGHSEVERPESSFFALQVPLGRLLDATWTPLVPLERLLDGSWALLDALQALSKCILHSKWAPTAPQVLSKWPPRVFPELSKATRTFDKA